MKARVLVLFLAFSVALYATDSKATLPRLSVPSDFPQQYQKASRTVAAAVVKAGLKPAEYLVEIEAWHGDGMLHFELWHESALKQRDDPHFRGDPSGKCRTVLYDSDHDRVAEIYGWR